MRNAALGNVRTGGALGIEKKYYDSSAADIAVQSNANMTGLLVNPSSTVLVSTPGVGDGYQQREGKRITCKYLEIRGCVTIASAEAQVFLPVGGSVTIWIILDTQTNGVNMDSEDCFTNPHSDVEGVPFALRNLTDGNSRFRILKQKTLNLNRMTFTQNGTNDYSWQGLSVPFKMYIPLSNMVINFNGGTTTDVANVLDNSIHVLAGKNVDSTVLMHYNARLRFVG